MLKLKNLRPKDFADYTCQVSVRNVCNIEDKSVTFRLTNATSKLLDCFLFCFSLTTNTCLKFCCVYRRVHAFFLAFSVSCVDFFRDYPISSDFSLHACVLAEELLSPLRLNVSCLVEEIAFSFHPLIFSVSLSLSPWVFLSFHGFFLCPLTFHSNALSLFISSSDSQCNVLSVCLVFPFC